MLGEGDSSSGSDGAPSEDNLEVEEIVKMIPVVDKKTKLLLQKKQKLKQQNKEPKAQVPSKKGLNK